MSYLFLLVLPLLEPLHLGCGFTFNVDVEEDRLASAHGQRLEVRAVDAGLHCKQTISICIYIDHTLRSSGAIM